MALLPAHIDDGRQSALEKPLASPSPYLGVANGAHGALFQFILHRAAALRAREDTKVSLLCRKEFLLFRLSSLFAVLRAEGVRETTIVVRRFLDFAFADGAGFANGSHVSVIPIVVVAGVFRKASTLEVVRFILGLVTRDAKEVLLVDKGAGVVDMHHVPTLFHLFFAAGAIGGLGHLEEGLGYHDGTTIEGRRIFPLITGRPPCRALHQPT